MIKYVLILLYGALGSFGMYFIKQGTIGHTLITFNSGILKLNLSVKFIIGFIMYVCSFLIYMYLMSKFNLSYIIPIATASFYLFVLFVSLVLLKEPFTIYSAIGFFFLLIGVIFLNIK